MLFNSNKTYYTYISHIHGEGEGATLECLQGGLCAFQGNLVFLPSGSECKIVQTITFLQGMFPASFLIMLFYEKEFIIN